MIDSVKKRQLERRDGHKWKEYYRWHNGEYCNNAGMGMEKNWLLPMQEYRMIKSNLEYGDTIITDYDYRKV